jgi:hypothetical protein
MRRFLILLALLVAGFGGTGAGMSVPVAPSGPASHELASPSGANPLAFLPAGSTLSPGAWQEVSGPDARHLPGRSTRRSARLAPSGDDDAPLSARALARPDHASSLALMRAGRSAFHTATPPPFRSV